MCVTDSHAIPERPFPRGIRRNPDVCGLRRARQPLHELCLRIGGSAVGCVHRRQRFVRRLRNLSTVHAKAKPGNVQNIFQFNNFPANKKAVQGVHLRSVPSGLCWGRLPLAAHAKFRLVHCHVLRAESERGAGKSLCFLWVLPSFIVSGLMSGLMALLLLHSPLSSILLVATTRPYRRRFSQLWSRMLGFMGSKGSRATVAQAFTSSLRSSLRG